MLLGDRYEGSVTKKQRTVTYSRKTTERPSMDSPSTCKSLGSFYTPPAVAERLVRWVIRSPSDCLLDPVCGDGRFLAAHSNVVGVDRDISAVSAAAGNVPHATVHVAEFLDWADTMQRRFDCVAGDPPFTRYQQFKGGVRKTALKFCNRLGMRLTGLTSSWAPFVVVSLPSSRLADGWRSLFPRR